MSYLKNLFSAVLLLALLGLSGCGGGLALLLLLISDGGSSSSSGSVGPVGPITTSVVPRESAVVGGVEVRIGGQGLNTSTEVFFGGKPASNLSFDSNDGSILATVPFQDDGTVGVTNPRPDPADWSDRYTEMASPALRMEVVTGSSRIMTPFWHMRPRLRQVSEGPLRAEAMGHLETPRFVDITGDYFGFGNDMSDSRVYLLRQDGTETTLIATIEEIPEPGDEGALTGPAFWFVEDIRCQVGDCAGDPHQGRSIRVRLPVRDDAGGNGSELFTGPNYLLRVVSQNGFDDLEIGYGPPFPPLSVECEVMDAASADAICESFTATPGNEDKQVVLIRWENNPLNNVTGEDKFESTFIERYNPARRAWDCLGLVAGKITCFVDSSAQHTNYTYRVYGQTDFDGDGVNDLSPARTCRAAVIPPGDLQFIWDLTGDAPDRDTSGQVLQDLLEGAGVLTFRVTPDRNDGSLSVPVAELFSGGDDRVRNVFITSDREAGFGALHSLSVDEVARYLRNVGGGLYVEGQHIGAAFSSSPDLRDLFVSTFNFDPLEHLLGFDDVVNVAFTRPPPLTGLNWRGGAGGITSYSNAVIRSPTGEEGVLTGMSVTDTEDGTSVGSSTIVGLLQENAGQGQRGLRAMISFLHIAGFDAGQRGAVLDRILGLIDPELRSEPGPMVTEIRPDEGAWDASVQVEISGMDFDDVDAVLFGTTRAPLITKNIQADGDPGLDSLLVDSPVVDAPGRVTVFLELSDETLRPGGFFQYTGRVPAIEDIVPPIGSKAGGQILELIGRNFTSNLDTRVFIDEIRASSGNLTSDGTFQKLLVRTPRFIRDDPRDSVPVTLRVETSAGSATGVFIYTDETDIDTDVNPRFISISPDEGAEVGTMVTITGRNLTTDTEALICDQPLLEATVDIVNNQIVGIAPPGTGTCDVMLTNLIGMSAQVPDVFTYRPPRLVSIAPTSDFELGGEDFTASGEFFTPESVVTIGGAALDSATNDPGAGEITGTIPPGCGIQSVAVTNPSTGSASTLDDAFEYRQPVVLDILPPEGPVAGGTEIAITGMGFGPETEISICDKPVQIIGFDDAGDGTQIITAITPPADMEGPCIVTVVNDPCPPVNFDGDVSFTYFRRVAFFGTFSFDLDDAGGIMPDAGGSSRMREFLDTKGFKITILGEDTLTEGALTDIEAIVFSVLQDRDLTAAEAQVMNDFVADGGSLLLLGQHGIQNASFKDTKNPDDRNLVAAAYGITFRDDVVADPSSHWLFDGCDDVNCIRVGSDSTSPQGDPDNGEEYVVIRPDTSEHPIVTGVEAVFFNWGQSLEVTDEGSLVLALRTSPQAYGDLDPTFNPGEGLCEIDWFENAQDGADHQDASGLISLAAMDVDGGRVVALGDQDMFWNLHWIRSGTTSADIEACDEFLFSHDKLIRNILSWMTNE